MKLLTNIVPQACFHSPQACFWRGLGASWASLGRNLDALGELLGSLGCLFAASWAPFGCFLGALGRIWALIGASVLDFESGGSALMSGSCWGHVGTFFALRHKKESAALLCSARRGRPHVTDMCLDIPAWIPLGEARASKLQTKILSW